MTRRSHHQTPRESAPLARASSSSLPGSRGGARESVAQRRKEGSRVKFGTSDFQFVPVASAKTPTAVSVSTDNVSSGPGSCRPGVPSASTRQPLHSPMQHALPARPPSSTGTTGPEAADIVNFSEDSTMVFNDDWRDYRQVMTALFAPPSNAGKEERSGADLHAAMRVLRLWQTRVRLHVREQPAYVVATRALVEAQLHDRIAQASLAGNGQTATSTSLHEPPETTAAVVVAVYCHALSRAVHLMTGITQKQQRHGTESQSTYRSRAQASGFPEEAVEVRTRIAHGAEPPLSELRWVTSLVLEHLYVKYWVVQRSHIEALVAERASRRAEVQQVGPETQRKRRRQGDVASNKVESFSLTSLESLLGAADASLRESEERKRRRSDEALTAPRGEVPEAATGLILGVRLRASNGPWATLWSSSL